MADIRAQTRFTLAPGDGSNVATCTMHFRLGGVPFNEHVGAVGAALADFWVTAPPGLAVSISGRMARTVIRQAEVRFYDMGTPAPREPHVVAFPLAAPVSADVSHVPMDVACCLSLRCLPPVERWNRGRIFIPGVADSWIQGGTETQLPLFSLTPASPVDVIVRAAKRLMQDEEAGWVIRSERTPGLPAWTPVEHAYVDSEPDTQRRRGLGSGAPRLTTDQV